MLTDFDRKVEKHQIEWRQSNISTRECGEQNGIQRSWIIPEKFWEEGLWQDLRRSGRDPLCLYLKENRIQKHRGVHNLKSSWILCANLYFTFRQDRRLLTSFLRHYIHNDIKTVDGVELEYAEDPPLNPKNLLGEAGGRRGANQTSPDLAFKITLEDGRLGLVLTECKFTEHSFYECSGRRPSVANPDPLRCLDIARLLSNIKGNCYQTNWETKARRNRTYWSHINVNDAGRAILRRCPAAISGYQLFRQQALAEALARSGKYGLVISSVAYDIRNTALANSLRGAGIGSIEEWGSIFDGQARFAAFSHQRWTAWVRTHDTAGKWRDWVNWIAERYDL